MSKKHLLALIICLAVLTALVMAAFGSHYTASYPLTRLSLAPGEQADFVVTAEEPGIVEVSNIRTDGSDLKFDLTALERGKTGIVIGTSAGDVQILDTVYVHRFNIITLNSYFGKCTAGFMVPLSILIVILILYVDRIRILRADSHETIYRYSNIMNLGLIIFATLLILRLVTLTLNFDGIDASITSVMGTAELFSYIALPVAVVVSFMVTISNLNLMIKEGRNWRNMLGFILGAGICFMTVFTNYLYLFVLRTGVVDIFNERGLGTQLYSLFEQSVFVIVAYLECVLIGTIVYGLKAARRIPAFDKDYILILGCQIRPDGSLTPLLRSRADRAIEFADMQKTSAGRDIVFVPSGGKGSDEVMAEADAIANYLRSTGIPDDRIIAENKSVNTYENIKNSMELILEDFAARGDGDDISGGHAGGDCEAHGEACATASTPGTPAAKPKVAFSTTNYHVFRAGLLAQELGYPMEGIGAPTKRYFWLNAFIREFIATLVSEKRHHLKIILVLFLVILLMVALHYVSVLL